MKSQFRVGDKIIVIEHADGTELDIKGNVVEVVSRRPLDMQLRKELEKEGIQWGDAVAHLTSKIGITACKQCLERKAILNHIRQLGVKEAAKQIIETFKWRRATSQT